MEKLKARLKDDYASILSFKDFNYIIQMTDFVIDNNVNEDNKIYYENEFLKNVQKYVLGQFCNVDSEKYLERFFKRVFKNKMCKLTDFQIISNFYRITMLYPEIDDILNLLKSNVNLNEFLKNMFEKYKNIIIAGKFDEICDDEFFIQFMEVFLDSNGILIEDNSFDVYVFPSDLNSTDMFFMEIEKYSVLNKEEEKELFVKFSRGVSDAKDKLVKHNLKLVLKIAKRYISNTIPLMDLVQEGTIGLMKAIDEFDYKKGYKFSTFATWWIRQKIIKYCDDMRSSIRFPSHIWQAKDKIRNISQEFEIKYGRLPTILELAKSTKYTLNTIKNIMLVPDNLESLNIKTGDETETELADMIIDDRYNIESDFEQSNLNKLILYLFKNANLKDQEKRVIFWRMGFINDEKKTLKEIAEIENLTSERIRQIEKRALGKFRNCMIIKPYAEYMDNPTQACYFIDECRRKYRIKGK